MVARESRLGDHGTRIRPMFTYSQSHDRDKNLRRNSKGLEAGSNGSRVDGWALGMGQAAVDEKVESGLFH